MHHRTWSGYASGLDFSTGHPYVSREKITINNRRDSTIDNFLKRNACIFISSFLDFFFFLNLCQCIHGWSKFFFFSRRVSGHKGWVAERAGKDRACVYNVCTCDRVSICKGIIDREREIDR